MEDGEILYENSYFHNKILLLKNRKKLNFIKTKKIKNQQMGGYKKHG